MSYFFIDIEDASLKNDNYREVIYTGKFQLVLMSIPPNDDIPLEKHDNIDQFIRIEGGEGKALIKTLNGFKEIVLKDGDSITIPPQTYHKIINTSSSKSLKLYTIYSSPQHAPGLIQKLNPEKYDDKFYSKMLKYYNLINLYF